jgi:hypothetical protein
MTARSAWTIVGLLGAAFLGVLVYRSQVEDERPPGSPPPRSARAPDDVDPPGVPDAFDPLDGEAGPEESGRDPSERLCRALGGCEPAQREAVERATEAYGRRAAELRDDIKTLRAPFEPLMLSEAPDEAAARAIVAELDEPRRALDEAALSALLAVHAVLTPAQRQKLARMVARRGPVTVLEGSRKRGQAPLAD